MDVEDLLVREVDAEIVPEFPSTLSPPFSSNVRAQLSGCVSVPSWLAVIIVPTQAPSSVSCLIIISVGGEGILAVGSMK